MHVVAVAAASWSLTELLHSGDPRAKIRGLLASANPSFPIHSVRVLAPLDEQEVWGAGVTYERSKVAREQESDRAASFYDLVYRADRPELFFKATPSRVVGPGQPIRVRRDSNWCVPEPELALVLEPGAGTRWVYRRQRREHSRHRGRKPPLPASSQGL